MPLPPQFAKLVRGKSVYHRIKLLTHIHKVLRILFCPTKLCFCIAAIRNEHPRAPMDRVSYKIMLVSSIYLLIQQYFARAVPQAVGVAGVESAW